MTLTWAVTLMTVEEEKTMRNLWKKETSKDYTAWDLNCRHVVYHTKGRNQLEKIFKRKNRRKVKRVLSAYC